MNPSSRSRRKDIDSGSFVPIPLNYYLLSMNLATSAPNWKKFLEKYPTSRHFLGKIEQRYEKLPDAEKNHVAKLLDDELGLTLLQEKEIDQKALVHMLSTLSK